MRAAFTANIATGAPEVASCYALAEQHAPW
jgi:hypothetical protein